MFLCLPYRYLSVKSSPSSIKRPPIHKGYGRIEKEGKCMPLFLVRGDITQMHVDAIVNAANSALKAGGGVCGAIFRAAGHQQLQEACTTLAPVQPGDAVITDGFNLHSSYIIHTVGPQWQGGTYNEADQLTSCYRQSLTLAREHNLTSLAFPLISSGIYGYPKDQAYDRAVSAILTELQKYELTVYLVLFDGAPFQEERIKPLLVPPHYTPTPSAVTSSKEPFPQSLRAYMKKKNFSVATLSYKANITQKLLQHILTQRVYHPPKNLVLACTIGLSLSGDQAQELLHNSGYALDTTSRSDMLILSSLIQQKNDIHTINEALFFINLPLLGEKSVALEKKL